MSFRFEPISSSRCKKFKEQCKNKTYVVGTVRVLPVGFVVTEIFVDYFSRIQDFEVHEDDTWIVSFPKSGTTWTQEMAWLLINNADFEGAKDAILNVRSPFFEAHTLATQSIQSVEAGEGSVDMEDAFTHMERMQRPRVIKTHLPVDLLPKQMWTKNPKIIYVSRDPKDAAISFFHHHRLWYSYEGTSEDFMELFLSEEMHYCPYWEHILGFWKLRDQPNVLYNTYEEMKSDLSGVIRRTAAFLGKHYDDHTITALSRHLSFDAMKENPSVNNEAFAAKERQKMRDAHVISDTNLTFIRQGKTDAWKKSMTPDLVQRFEKWSHEKLKNSDYTGSVSSE